MEFIIVINVIIVIIIGVLRLFDHQPAEEIY